MIVKNRGQSTFTDQEGLLGMAVVQKQETELSEVLAMMREMKSRNHRTFSWIK